MDTLTERYRKVIKEIILDFADEQPTMAEVTLEVVMDDERGHYEVLEVGWHGNKRVHFCCHYSYRSDWRQGLATA